MAEVTGMNPGGHLHKIVTKSIIIFNVVTFDDKFQTTHLHITIQITSIMRLQWRNDFYAEKLDFI